MRTQTKKILITGGHVTPAIAVIDQIRSLNLPWTIVFVGRTKAVEGGSHFDLEKKLIEEKNIAFIPIQTGRIQRSFTKYTLVSLIKIPFGFVHAMSILRKEKPNLILSFGGYIAVPIVVAAALLKIPVVTHEQTRKPGLANRLIAHFAKRIFVSFEDIGKSFPPSKVVYTGLPIRKEILEPSQKPPFAVDLRHYPVIYVTGGSTGSESINNLLFPIIPELLQNYTVIHQTGFASFVEAHELRRRLSSTVRDRYIIGKYFEGEEASWIIQHASLVVGRSGANTVMELALLGKRAICIPLPWAGAGEQSENAHWLESLGLSDVIEQKTATSESLQNRIVRKLTEKPEEPSRVSSLPRDGAKRVTDELTLLLA